MHISMNPQFLSFSPLQLSYSARKGYVETYYCLRQAVGDDLIFEVEVIDPKDEQGDV